MPAMATKGTLERTRDALRSPDFRRLFLVRLASQFADGLFQVSLIASVVFSPDKQSTTVGLFKATLVIAAPVLGDRAVHRRVHRPVAAAPDPDDRAVGEDGARLAGVVRSGARAPVLFFAGALLVLSANRFFLATAQAVVPRLVPTEDLLMANSLATVGGTVALLAGVYLGGKIADAFGNARHGRRARAPCGWSARGSRRGSAATWRRTRCREDPSLLRHELRRVGVEFGDGIDAPLAHAEGARTDHVDLARPVRPGPGADALAGRVPRALRRGRGLVLQPDRRRRDRRAARHPHGRRLWRIGSRRSGSWPARSSSAGVSLSRSRSRSRASTVLIASFAVGLTFAWKKIPIDTMVQESLPDGYRGRVFAAYDVAYNLARIDRGGAGDPDAPAPRA